MKMFYFFLLTLFSVNGAIAQWVQQNSGTTRNLNSVYFTDSNTGYIVGDHGIILKTTDGGTNWMAQSSGTIHDLRSVYFTDAGTGYAVGMFNVLLKTVNGGIDWTIQNLPIPVHLQSIHFPAQDTGYAIGNYYAVNDSCPNGLCDSSFIYILKTTNGGTLWSISYNRLSIGWSLYYLISVLFTDANFGYAVGYSHYFKSYYVPLILKTTNGGFEWTNKDAGGAGEAHSVFFTNADTGYVAGWYYSAGDLYKIIKTIDGGLSWIYQNNQNDGTPANSVFFTDVNSGYAVGEDIITKTRNSGTDWSEQTSGTTNALNSVYFPCPDTGYAVGENGIVLKTTNGGGNVGMIDHNKTGQTLTITPNPAYNSILIKTPVKGSIFILNINGQRLLEQKNIEQGMAIDVSIFPEGIYVVKVVGENGIWVGKMVKE
jgi:photosystem II stability/assembly factor-like uncharacterized protein